MRPVLALVVALIVVTGLMSGCIPRHPPHTPRPVPEVPNQETGPSDQQQVPSPPFHRCDELNPTLRPLELFHSVDLGGRCRSVGRYLHRIAPHLEPPARWRLCASDGITAG
jgi:hypothetical protein